MSPVLLSFGSTTDIHVPREALSTEAPRVQGFFGIDYGGAPAWAAAPRFRLACRQSLLYNLGKG